MIDLISYKKENNITTVVFNVFHNNGTSTLEQFLILENQGNGWIAKMEMEGFTEQETPTLAARKLANWFERMAGVLKKAELDLINLNKVQK